MLILGLGIGMAVAVWTVFNAALLRRPPVEDMASAVREQTRDIGVRMALGATPARVRGEVDPARALQLD